MKFSLFLLLMPKFYVYLHCRPDGTPFYVGKGLYRRCYDFRSRSNYHKNVVRKCGGQKSVRVETVECLNEEEAFYQERIFILLLREQGVRLVNLTDGGEGTSGLVLSEDSRRTIGFSNLGNSNGSGNKGQKRGAYRKLKSGPHGNSGRTMSEERRYVQYLLRLGNRGSSGFSHSDESKKKISEKSKEMWSQGPRRWITNGSNNMRILEGTRMPCGWWYGKSRIFNLRSPV